MNCKQAVSLINRYLDERLDYTSRSMFENHIKECNSCKTELQLNQRIFEALYSYNEVKTPAGFTDNVMDYIYKLEESKKNIQKKGPLASSFFFRRLGYSMIITAVVMIISLWTPFSEYNNVNSLAPLETGRITQGTDRIYESFYEINYMINRYFRDVNNSITKIKEEGI